MYLLFHSTLKAEALVFIYLYEVNCFAWTFLCGFYVGIHRKSNLSYLLKLPVKLCYISN